MARTTLDIDTPLLRELKELQKKEGRSLGRIVSQLLAEALAHRKTSRRGPPFAWTIRPMGARVDLSDKDAVYRILDGDDR
jgi:hypothetical protein